MRLSVVVLLCAVAGILGGGALIGMAALGGCLIFVSLCAAVWALLRDDGAAVVPSVHELPTVGQVLERARRAA